MTSIFTAYLGGGTTLFFYFPVIFLFCPLLFLPHLPFLPRPPIARISSVGEITVTEVSPVGAATVAEVAGIVGTMTLCREMSYGGLT